jgi:hypothetical protein
MSSNKERKQNEGKGRIGLERKENELEEERKENQLQEEERKIKERKEIE